MPVHRTKSRISRPKPALRRVEIFIGSPENVCLMKGYRQKTRTQEGWAQYNCAQYSFLRSCRASTSPEYSAAHGNRTRQWMVPGMPEPVRPAPGECAVSVTCRQVSLSPPSYRRYSLTSSMRCYRYRNPGPERMQSDRWHALPERAG